MSDDKKRKKGKSPRKDGTQEFKFEDHGGLDRSERKGTTPPKQRTDSEAPRKPTLTPDQVPPADLANAAKPNRRPKTTLKMGIGDDPRHPQRLEDVVETSSGQDDYAATMISRFDTLLQDQENGPASALYKEMKEDPVFKENATRILRNYITSQPNEALLGTTVRIQGSFGENDELKNLFNVALNHGRKAHGKDNIAPLTQLLANLDNQDYEAAGETYIDHFQDRNFATAGNEVFQGYLLALQDRNDTDELKRATDILHDLLSSIGVGKTVIAKARKSLTPKSAPAVPPPPRIESPPKQSLGDTNPEDTWNTGLLLKKQSEDDNSRRGIHNIDIIDVARDIVSPLDQIVGRLSEDGKVGQLRARLGGITEAVRLYASSAETTSKELAKAKQTVKYYEQKVEDLKGDLEDAKRDANAFAKERDTMAEARVSIAAEAGEAEDLKMRAEQAKEDAEKSREEIQLELNDARTNLSAEQARVDTLEKEKNAKGRELSDAEKRIGQLEIEIRQYRSDIIGHEQKYERDMANLNAAHEKETTHLNATISDQSDVLDKNDMEIGVLKRAGQDITAQRDKAATANTELKRRLQLASEEIERYTCLMGTKDDTISDLESAAANTLELLLTAQANLQLTKEENQSLAHDITTARSEAESHKMTAHDMEQSRNTAIDEYESAKEQIAELEENLQDSQDELESAEQARQAAVNREEALELSGAEALEESESKDVIIRQLEAEREELIETLQAKGLELDNLASQYSLLTGDKQVIKESFDEAKQTISNRDRTIEDKEAEIASLTERLEAVDTKLGSAQFELMLAEEDVTKFRDDNAAWPNAIAAVAEQNAVAMADVEGGAYVAIYEAHMAANNADRRLGLASVEITRLLELAADRKDLSERVAWLERDLHHKTAENEHNVELAARLYHEIGAVEDRHERVVGKIVGYFHEEIANLEESNESLTAANEKAKTTIRTRIAKIKELQGLYDNTLAEAKRLAGELESTQSEMEQRTQTAAEKLQERTSERDSARNDFEKRTRRYERLSGAARDIKNELTEKIQELAHTQEQLQTSNKELTEAEEDRARIANLLTTEEEKYASAFADARRLESELSDSKKLRRQRTDERDSARNDFKKRANSYRRLSSAAKKIIANHNEELELADDNTAYDIALIKSLTVDLIERTKQRDSARNDFAKRARSYERLSSAAKAIIADRNEELAIADDNTAYDIALIKDLTVHLIERTKQRADLTDRLERRTAEKDFAIEKERKYHKQLNETKAYLQTLETDLRGKLALSSDRNNSTTADLEDLSEAHGTLQRRYHRSQAEVERLQGKTSLYKRIAIGAGIVALAAGLTAAGFATDIFGSDNTPKDPAPLVEKNE